MTSRFTIHWGSQNSYAAAFVNGRKQQVPYSSIIYDAAGNMLDSGGIAANNSWQKTTVEASGRTNSTKTRYRELRGSRYPTYWIIENEVQQKYDGDGHPLKIINSTQTVETTPLPQPYTEIKYQIWSSVMNTTLTELRENGSKAETKVFAGGAVIAKQYDNPQTPDFVRWLHADPVTGSRQEVQKNGVGEDYLRTELEPLGQEIQPIKPDEELPTGTTASNNSADSPEWLCKYASKDYWDMPIACQRAKNEDPDFHLDQLFKQEGNPAAIDKNPKQANNLHELGNSIGGDKLSLSFKRGASSTTKRMKDNDEKPVITADVEVKISFDDEIFSGFQGAESGFIGKDTPQQLPECLRNLLRKFFPSITITSKTDPKKNTVYSPVDDARFIDNSNWVFGYSATTYGLTSIYFNSEKLDLMGGHDGSSIKTIAEEIAHAEQFLKHWESLGKIEVLSGGDRFTKTTTSYRDPTYADAQVSFWANYLTESGKQFVGTLGKTNNVGIAKSASYFANKYEVEAQRIASDAYANTFGKMGVNPCQP
jgi:hypothetical protein